MKFSDLKLSNPYLNLDAMMYSRVAPSPLQNPFIISVSQSAAVLLGVDENLLRDGALLKILNAEEFLEGSEPFSMAYAGHQFGHFAGVLGDGRVINLGKVNGQNLQLKGSGLTPYSRHGDGRAVVRSSIREYLISEAMHGLGIATSRALGIIGSQSDVERQGVEKGAIVLRLSPTWVRFGTFEYLNAIGEHEKIKELADYVIEESFSHLKGSEDCYLKMYAEIVKSTATTIAQWQSVGFNHGVMNTDNMSIDGCTIDYGPFAFMDDYDPHSICNKSDTQGRYRFSSQPGVGYWNLEMLALALSPILSKERAEEILQESYWSVYEELYFGTMYAKMGLERRDEDDRVLLARMLKALQNATIDYSLFFRKLSRFDGDKSAILDIAIYREPLSAWLDTYTLRLQKEQLSKSKRHEKMLKTNPNYILKSHLLQEAIEGVQRDDFTLVEALLKVALSPFEEYPELEHLATPAPQNAKNIKLSCSS